MIKILKHENTYQDFDISFNYDDIIQCLSGKLGKSNGGPELHSSNWNYGIFMRSFTSYNFDDIYENI